VKRKGEYDTLGDEKSKTLRQMRVGANVEGHRVAKKKAWRGWGQKSRGGGDHLLDNQVCRTHQRIQGEYYQNGKNVHA